MKNNRFDAVYIAEMGLLIAIELVMKLTGLSRNTYYKYKKELAAELNP